MYSLSVNSDWAQQIARIRDANTEDSNLMRFDNTFYRLCRAEPTRFTVQLRDGIAHGGPTIDLVFQANDFYVHEIAGQPFGRYPSTIDLERPTAQSLASAIAALAKGEPQDRFLRQAVLVFCVAESLRSDEIATAVGQMIATTKGLLGVPSNLAIFKFLPLARAWGQTSDAIHRALSSTAREIVSKPRSALTPQQRSFSERVDLSRVDPSLQGYAKSIRALKRPGVS